MKRFGRYAEAEKMLLNDDGTLRTAEHCLSVVAMLLSHVAEAEAETAKLQERLSYVLSQGV